MTERVTDTRLAEFIAAYTKYADDHNLDEFGEYRILLSMMRELAEARAKLRELGDKGDM